MNRTPRTLALTLACALAFVFAACAEDGTRDTTKTKNAALEATLINADFAPNGGGWVGDRYALDGGCASKNPLAGRPSLGVWAKSGLAFGFDTAVVEQAVVVPRPSTVTFQITGYVRADNPDGWFKIDVADSNESQSSGRQTGKGLIFPKIIQLTITTSRPNEYMSIMMTGSSGNNWAGCFGPVLKSARLFVSDPVPTTGGGLRVLATAAPTTTKPLPPSTPAPSTTTTSTTSTTTSTTSTTTSAPATTTTASGGCAQLYKDRGANCQNADLRGVNLRANGILEANFKGANLAGADLRWTTLTGSDFSGANLSGALLSGASGRGATFVGANLTGANFDLADFGTSNFTDANLTNASLFRAKFDYAKLIRANLTGASVVCSSFIVDMTGATIKGATIKDSLLVGATMPDGTRAISSGEIPYCVK